RRHTSSLRDWSSDVCSSDLGGDTVTIDTANPSVVVDIVDGSLNDGDNASQVTFTFSEEVSADTVADLASGTGITVSGGTLSALKIGRASCRETGEISAAAGT